MTDQQLNWHSKCAEAVKDLKNLRREHEKLLQTFAAVAAENARMKQQIFGALEKLK